MAGDVVDLDGGDGQGGEGEIHEHGIGVFGVGLERVEGRVGPLVEVGCPGGEEAVEERGPG